MAKTDDLGKSGASLADSLQKSRCKAFESIASLLRRPWPAPPVAEMAYRRLAGLRGAISAGLGADAVVGWVGCGPADHGRRTAGLPRRPHEHAEIGPEGGGGGREAAQMVWLGGREPSVPTRLAEWATCAASLAALTARPASGGCSSLVGRGSPGDGIAGGPVLAETASRWSSDHRGSVSATPAGWPRAV